jgi:hypothetical protein
MTADGSEAVPLRRRTVLAGAMAAVGLAGAARAYADPDPVGLQVVDRGTGRSLRVWRHDGRLFIAGEPGARYSLRVTNRSDDRVMVVLSVDGVNILSGETASYDQNGYVFDPRESYDISGWRKSDTQVAAFAFAPLSQSYAARTGRPGDVGVIGMAVFREKVFVPPPEPKTSEVGPEWRDEAGRSSSVDAPSLRAVPAPAPPPPPTGAPPPQDRMARGGVATEQDEKLGTAHGAREWSVVRTVSFVRATPYPQSVRQIEYDTYAHLVAAGVIPRWREPEPRPRPFPLNPENGYVPDPPPGD